MSYHVAIQSYEGPLDLLLQLVEQAELHITTISLGEITDQYLGSIQTLPDLHPSELSSFMELATRLVYLKSLALLPDLSPPQVAEQQAFIEELQSYQQYRTAADQLGSLLRAGNRSWHRPVGEQLEPSDLPLPELSVADLQAAFTAALARLPEPKTTLELEQIMSLDEMLAYISKRLHDKSELLFGTLISDLNNRPNAIVAFLAILELLKQGTVVLVQTELFDDIVVRHV